MGSPDVVRKAEQPWRRGKQHPAREVEREMHRHGDAPYHPQLVVGEETVENRPGTEHDRDPRFRAASVEAEQPGGGNQQHTDHVVERTMHSRRNEAHKYLLGWSEV